MDRIESIQANVELWIAGKLQLSQDDLMPDIIFLLELIKQYKQTMST